jgi:DNA-binding IclR family transcriptional regulator
MTLDLLFPAAISRIIDVFMIRDGYDLTVAELARKSMCSTRTVKRALSTLKSMDMVSISREIGRIKLWRLNRRSPAVKYLILFCLELDKR